jgi:hypothetical protein
MKRYNVKLKLKNYWIEYPNCYFIDSLDSYKEYMAELNNKFLVSESEIKNIKTFIGHGHSFLTGLSGLFCGMIEEKEDRTPMLAHLKYLQATILSDQLKHLLAGEKLVVNKDGGYFPIKLEQEYKITEIDGDKFTTKDISVKKWWGGKHYYAKVGNVDVVDDYGDVKWNTEQYAYDVAVKYMNKLNSL